MFRSVKPPTSGDQWWRVSLAFGVLLALMARGIWDKVVADPTRDNVMYFGFIAALALVMFLGTAISIRRLLRQSTNRDRAKDLTRR